MDFSVFVWINLMWVTTTFGERQELCIGEVFKAECSGHSVMMVNKALYGRMSAGKCVKDDLGHIGCENDVRDALDILCSGRKKCEMFVPNEELIKRNQNCRGLELYLEAQYSCVKVEYAREVCSQGSTLKLDQPHGYIASHVLDTTRCGAPGAPWEFMAKPGQTVEMWLLDFGAATRGDAVKYSTCVEILGFVTENSIGVNKTICHGDTRRSLLYSSKTNNVVINLVPKANRISAFVIEYKFVGCTEFTVSDAMWYKRDGNSANIGCKSDNRKWTLMCRGGLWEGTHGNCSTLQETTKTAHVTQRRTNLSFSSIVLLTGVVCASVLLIFLVVVAGTVYIKKQSIKHGVKIRSEYGFATMPANLFTTNKNPGYNTNTLKSQMTSSCPNQATDDSQPLVHIWERTLPDPRSSVTPGYPGTGTSTAQSLPNATGKVDQADLLQ